MQRKNDIARKLGAGLFLASALLVALWTQPAIAQSERVFTVPLAALQSWSEKVVIPMDVEIRGHSGVHGVKSDCEMHFGARVAAYHGDPSGWVLEPMNLCLEVFPGKSKHSNKDWTKFGDGLKGKTVQVKGVPRIWREHLVGGNGPSNPNHALELHPLTELVDGSKSYDFRSYIYAPADFPGGVSFDTAKDILTDTEVKVTETGGNVEVSFDSGRIGNFTTLQIRVSRDSITEVDGGHRMDGDVILTRSKKVRVRMVTVTGTDVDSAIATFETGHRKKGTFEFLVLFSLSPETLFEAAKQSQGQTVTVEHPIELIAYGEPQ